MIVLTGATVHLGIQLMTMTVVVGKPPTPHALVP